MNSSACPFPVRGSNDRPVERTLPCGVRKFDLDKIAGAFRLAGRRRAPVCLLHRASTRTAAGRSSVSFLRVQGLGDRRPASRVGGRTPPNRSSATYDGGPRLPGGGKSALAALALDVLHRQADDPARVASAVGRQALDVPSSSWAKADESVSSETSFCDSRARMRVAVTNASWVN